MNCIVILLGLKIWSELFNFSLCFIGSLAFLDVEAVVDLASHVAQGRKQLVDEDVPETRALGDAREALEDTCHAGAVLGLHVPLSGRSFLQWWRYRYAGVKCMKMVRYRQSWAA